MLARQIQPLVLEREQWRLHLMTFSRAIHNQDQIVFCYINSTTLYHPQLLILLMQSDIEITLTSATQVLEQELDLELEPIYTVLDVLNYLQ